MKVVIAAHVSKGPRQLQRAVALCLLFVFVTSACGTPAATEAPAIPAAPTPTLAIVTGGPCEVSSGGTMPLSVTGMPGTDVTYSWTASAGNVNPPDKAAVTYTAPDTPMDVIITVTAQKGEVALQAMINCKVTGPTPIPADTPTLEPTLTPVPSPTSWACTSYRSQKLENGDVPGEVRINTPAQGAVDLLSGRPVQVAGSYTGLPAGKYLWVFIYSGDAGSYGRYYPQTKDAVNRWQPEPTTGADGSFTLNVNFGAPNLCYELIVLVTDATASQAIADQLARWADAKDYTGYELNGPPSADPPNPPGFPSGLVEKASIEVRSR